VIRIDRSTHPGTLAAVTIDLLDRADTARVDWRVVHAPPEIDIAEDARRLIIKRRRSRTTALPPTMGNDRYRFSNTPTLFDPSAA
jgi:hypothetical protein